MNDRLFFYKLVSPYPEDITKDCKLTVKEIDENFLTLKNASIKEVKLSDDNRTLILVRNDGEEITTSLEFLDSFADNLSVEWDKENGVISITWNGETVKIDGIVTDNTGLKYLVTDNSLSGDGTHSNPLMIARTEETGFFAPVKKVIDITEGESLPEEPSLGDRYLTSEWISDYGYLYNYYAVVEIEKLLKKDNSEWRIPTKADWDKLLNFTEPCEYQNHDSEVCHRYLGKYAGQKLKSRDKWKEFTVEPYVDEDGLIHNAVQPGGIDEYGFRVLPAGVANEDEEQSHFTEKTGFWTSSHIKTPEHEDGKGDLDQDIYVKIFDYTKSGVLQEADCPGVFYSLRLVKDFDGTNDRGAEVINGVTYETILMKGTSQVWTKINVSYPTEKKKLIPNNGEDIDKHKVYFINVFNGEDWDKKALVYGDTILTNEGGQYENEEYRVFIDENGDQQLLSVDDIVFERVMDKVQPILDQEREERIAADEELQRQIDEEREARISDVQRLEEADRQIWESLNNEIRIREEVDNQQWAAIENEARTREEVDNQQWAAIENEAHTREEVDNQQWAAIEEETRTREEVDNQQWAAIENEAHTREEVDNQQWEAIRNEAATREEVDNQQWAAIEEETRTREEIDNQQWAAIENEAATREEIDNQQWEAIRNEAATREEVDNQQWAAIEEETHTREEIDNQQWAAIENEARTREEVDNQQWAAIENEARTREDVDNQIWGQIIDNPNDPSGKKNPNTPDEYVLSVNSGTDPNITLFSKGGTNNIEIFLDGNYGEL